MKYLTILTLLFTLTAGANEKLLKAIPQECNIIIGVKVSDLLKVPIIKENLKNIPNAAQDENLKPENIKEIIIGLKAQSEMELTTFSQKPKGFIVLETVKPVKLNDALKMLSDDDVKITKQTYLNKEYYEGESNGEIIGIHQISDTLFIMGTKELLHKGMSVSNAAGKNIMDSAIMKKLLKPEAGLIYSGGFMSQSPDFKGYSLLLNYNKGLKLNTKLYCKKAEKATALAAQGNALVPMLTANPQMGIKPEHIKITASGTSLNVSAFVSENTLKQIPMMIQSMMMPKMEPQQ